MITVTQWLCASCLAGVISLRCDARHRESANKQFIRAALIKNRHRPRHRHRHLCLMPGQKAPFCLKNTLSLQLLLLAPFHNRSRMSLFPCHWL